LFVSVEGFKTLQPRTGQRLRPEAAMASFGPHSTSPRPSLQRRGIPSACWRESEKMI
jgi:hypothetical protein